MVFVSNLQGPGPVADTGACRSEQGESIHVHLTGSDVALLGIMGALMGAVVTANCLLGRLGFIEVMRAARSRS